MRLWDDDEWSNFCKAKDHDRVREALEGRGFKARGFVNGKPVLEGEIDLLEIQTIVANALTGTVAAKPPTSPSKPKAKGRGK